MDPTAGDSVLLAGRYRLGALLGRGGMAEVYDGFDERLARPVAVKILRPAAADDTAMRLRFEREARSVARLSHPAVVSVYDSGDERGRAFLVMERLPGETLADRMRQGPVDQRWLAPVAADVLGALAAAHDLGLVHRDIKPANILLTPDGRAKVADFGIAKTYRDDDDTDGRDLTATGLILGTVAYLSPEQIAGAAASPQADIYALGVVLYEALAGRKPFAGDNPIAQARAASDGAADDLVTLRPDVDPRLAAVVRRGMARRVEDRYPTAAGMLADLMATGLVDGAVDRTGAAAADPTVAVPGPAPTVVMAGGPVVDPTRVAPVSPSIPNPGVTRSVSGAGAPSSPSGSVPPAATVDRRRAALVGAIVALAVVVVVAAVVAVLVHHHDSSPTVTPPTSAAPATTATTAASTTTASTAAPTTSAPATTTPTTAAPTTAPTTTPTTSVATTTPTTSVATTTPTTTPTTTASSNGG
jgi:serine/threonine protein kinase